MITHEKLKAKALSDSKIKQHYDELRIEELLSDARKAARKAGAKKSDIDQAIKKALRKRNNMQKATDSAKALFLNDREDYLLGIAVLEKKEPTISIADLEKKLGLTINSRKADI